VAAVKGKASNFFCDEEEAWPGAKPMGLREGRKEGRRKGGVRKRKEEGREGGGREVKKYL